MTFVSAVRRFGRTVGNVFAVSLLAACAHGVSSSSLLPQTQTAVAFTSSSASAAATQFTSYPVIPSAEPSWMVVGPDGALWFDEPCANAIGRMDSAGIGSQYPIPLVPASRCPAIPEYPSGIAAGSDGALWFSWRGGLGFVGRVTTTGLVTTYQVRQYPSRGSAPFRIAAGPDGALWFTERALDLIGRVTTTGTTTGFPIPTAGAGLQGIATGSDHALWFAEMNANKIGRMTTTGVVTEYLLLPGSRPAELTLGGDGAIWFTNAGTDSIGRITPAGVVTYYPLPPTLPPTSTPPVLAYNGPGGITAGLGSDIWFTHEGAGAIGKIDATGTITLFTIPTPNSWPLGITLGRDHKLWFAEAGLNAIGTFAPAGYSSCDQTGQFQGVHPGQCGPNDNKSDDEHSHHDHGGNG